MRRVVTAVVGLYVCAAAGTRAAEAADKVRGLSQPGHRSRADSVSIFKALPSNGDGGFAVSVRSLQV